MESLDDIKFAVINTFGEVIGFFGDEHFAQDLIDKQGDPKAHKILKRDEDEFHIDIHTDITSSFDVRG